MPFNEKLVALRKGHGMSQQELSERLNVSRQTVSGWERGTMLPSAENLSGIKQLFCVSIDALLSDEEPAGVPLREISVSKDAAILQNALRILSVCALLAAAQAGLLAGMLLP